MKGILLGFAMCAGLVIAWRMRAVARRYDAPDHPSGPETSAVAAAGAQHHAPCGHRRGRREPVPCTGPHVDDQERAT